MINKIKNWSIDFFAKEDSTYHILTFLISSILFSSFPIIWFIIFMKEKMIFSYDFFTNGMFGLSIFFLFSLILLFMMGFILIGFITFLIIYLYKKKNEPNHSSKYIFIWLFLFNSTIIYLTFKKINTNIQYDIYAYVIIFTFFTFLHIGILYVGKGLHKFISLIVFILIFTFSTIVFHTIISDFVETGLAQFRMGGGIQTQVVDSANHNYISDGNLTLLTPNKIFLQQGNKTKIFNRNNVVIELLDTNAS